MRNVNGFDHSGGLNLFEACDLKAEHTKAFLDLFIETISSEEGGLMSERIETMENNIYNDRKMVRTLLLIAISFHKQIEKNFVEKDIATLSTIAEKVFGPEETIKYTKHFEEVVKPKLDIFIKEKIEKGEMPSTKEINLFLEKEADVYIFAKEKKAENEREKI